MFAASKTDSVSGAAPDAQFNYVTMLLHGDGTNGAQNNTFLDSSTNNFTITRNGNTTQGSFSPYGSNWSNYFDGSGDYLTSTWSTIGANQFTCEVWVYLPTGGNSRNYIVAPGTDTATHYDGFGLEIFNDYVAMWAGSNGTGWNLVTSDTSQGKSVNLVPRNTWTHIAMTRDSSGNFRSFINGKLECYVSPGTAALADSSTTVLNIGRTRYTGDFANFQGYMSNLRIVNGSVVSAYSTSSTTIGDQIFTTPTTSLTAITNTSLLTCQSNRFIDNSTNNYSITSSGNSSVQRFSPFGASTAYSTSVIGGSGYFDAASDYLSISGGVTNSGTGDFTLEFWAYYTGTYSTYQFVFDSRTSAGSFTNGFNVGVNLTNGYWYAGFEEQELLTSIPATKNGWDHVAVTRSGTTMRLFVNGVVGATYTTSNNLTSTTNYIGTYYATSQYYFPGYISNLRAIKGTALYTSAFTPSTTPLTAISGTSLLTNFTNGAIFDNAMMNDLETVGSAQISTSVKKYGTGSLLFDGNDLLLAPHTPNMNFGSGDFTIEAWVYRTSESGTNNNIFQKGITTSSNFQLNLSINPSNQLFSFYSTDGSSVTSIGTTSTTIPQTTWTHVAVSRSGNTWRYFINGTLETTTTAAVTLFTGTGLVSVGANPEGNSGFYGYIDDLRVTRGYARYTASFTPPTAAFSDTGPY